MHSTEVLMSEHRLIERVLDATEAAAARVDRGESVRVAFFDDAVAFLVGFADGCHHHKEEDVLFPAMVAAGLPREAGPIAVMLDEHEQGRALIRGIRAASAGLTRGEPGAASTLADQVGRYVALLRDHIAKEDQVLFPMAGQLLSGQLARDTAQSFDRAEQEEKTAGTPDRFRRLADALVAEMSREGGGSEAHAPEPRVRAS